MARERAMFPQITWRMYLFQQSRFHPFEFCNAVLWWDVLDLKTVERFLRQKEFGHKIQVDSWRLKSPAKSTSLATCSLSEAVLYTLAAILDFELQLVRKLHLRSQRCYNKWCSSINQSQSQHCFPLWVDVLLWDLNTQNAEIENSIGLTC